MYQSCKASIRGVAPLIVHNGQLADPLNPFAKALKEVTSTRKKTDDDYERMAEIEFRGGLYVDEAGSPVIPGESIEAALVEGAKKNKLGKVAKASIIVDGNIPIIYDGPRDADSLWSDPKFRKTVAVRVGTARVMRTRPIFYDWSLKFEIQFLPDQINKREVAQILESAGMCGLGTWRPRFGRFQVC
jgi:hypothetical protein